MKTELLRSFDVNATMLNENHTVKTMNDFILGNYRVIYMSAEDLENGADGRRVLMEPHILSRVVAIVIDEAHLFYEWYTSLIPLSIIFKI